MPDCDKIVLTQSSRSEPPHAPNPKQILDYESPAFGPYYVLNKAFALRLLLVIGVMGFVILILFIIN
jgi:hypothetical protein